MFFAHKIATLNRQVVQSPLDTGRRHTAAVILVKSQSQREMPEPSAQVEGHPTQVQISAQRRAKGQQAEHQGQPGSRDRGCGCFGRRAEVCSRKHRVTARGGWVCCDGLGCDGIGCQSVGCEWKGWSRCDGDGRRRVLRLRIGRDGRRNTRIWVFRVARSTGLDAKIGGAGLWLYGGAAFQVSGHFAP